MSCESGLETELAGILASHSYTGRILKTSVGSKRVCKFANKIGKITFFHAMKWFSSSCRSCLSPTQQKKTIFFSGGWNQVESENRKELLGVAYQFGVCLFEMQAIS